jgi:glycosyltransferase involved in cell wall biosynthesis
MEQILIISFWNPIPKKHGLGIFIHDQVNALCKKRSDIVFLEVNILSSKNSLFKKKIANRRIHLNEVITINIYSILWKFIFWNPWLVSCIITNHLKKKCTYLNPTIIHSNIIFPCGVVGHLLSKKYKAEHLISEHWSKAEKILKHPLYKSIVLKAYKKSIAILCVSKFLANKISQATNNANTVIVPNIIDTALFCFSPKLHEDNNVIRFTCIATWKKPKRLDLIINSLRIFAEEGERNILLTVVGEGEQKEEFQKIEYNQNLKINWLGYLSRTEITQVLRRTDIFLHASEIETFSMVTAEALSTGTPVLASNTGALPELINSTNGVLVENTVQSWIKGLDEITKKRQFNNKMISEDAVGKYSSDLIVKQIEKVYMSIQK